MQLFYSYILSYISFCYLVNEMNQYVKEPFLTLVMVHLNRKLCLQGTLQHIYFVCQERLTIFTLSVRNTSLYSLCVSHIVGHFNFVGQRCFTIWPLSVINTWLCQLCLSGTLHYMAFVCHKHSAMSTLSVRNASLYGLCLS